MYNFFLFCEILPGGVYIGRTHGHYHFCVVKLRNLTLRWSIYRSKGLDPATCTSLTLSDSLNRYLHLVKVCYTVYLWYRHRYTYRTKCYLYNRFTRNLVGMYTMYIKGKVWTFRAVISVLHTCPNKIKKKKPLMSFAHVEFF